MVTRCGCRGAFHLSVVLPIVAETTGRAQRGFGTHGVPVRLVDTARTSVNGVVRAQISLPEGSRRLLPEHRTRGIVVEGRSAADLRPISAGRSVSRTHFSSAIKRRGRLGRKSHPAQAIGRAFIKQGSGAICREARFSRNSPTPPSMAHTRPVLSIRPRATADPRRSGDAEAAPQKIC
jgi:hypothetical protein